MKFKVEMFECNSFWWTERNGKKNIFNINQNKYLNNPFWMKNIVNKNREIKNEHNQWNFC